VPPPGARDGRRREWTFAEVAARSAALAGALQRAGVGRGTGLHRGRLLPRVVERELLPLAAELDIGVLVMRPLGQGALAAKEPPAQALEQLAPFGVKTWPQVLLKWILSDRRVTAVLPATSSVLHARQNAVAGDPPWFGPEEREYVARLAEQL